MVCQVIHVVIGRVGVVQHEPMAEDQGGGHRHHDPRRRRRGTGHEDAVAEHEDDRPNHAILLDGNGIDQIAAIDEVDGGEVLRGQHDQHLEAKQASLDTSEMKSPELQRRP